ncbi:hypothetical protein [Ralstonia pseudosolanacearum]|uniref:hypothetical protein n=1 Tax=Ralstonia pseudosolanacearum TaxID=1310165 RepID=UPI001FF88648|nr:hypothetical protein [Ralstonia pseudosolanacearum]
MHLKELTLLKPETLGNEHVHLSRLVVRIDGRDLEANNIHRLVDLAGIDEDYLRAKDALLLRQRILAEVEREIFRGLR